MKIIPYEKYPGMYQLQWEDGTLSADFYNKTRAIEHCRVIEFKTLYKRPTEVTDAFK